MSFLLALFMVGWTEVPDEHGWQRLLSSPDELNDFEFHPGTMKRSGDLVQIWSRSNIVSFDTATAAFSKHGRYFRLSEIDCRRKLIREIRTVARKNNGGRAEEETQPATEFAPVLDGSIGGYLEQVACTKR
ncbi:surface-adhesin E family protein [Sphingopyxis sp.]|uniref:surface-adhesin E family protein n=1 Tax=Sphingopyxis sp. TaxID=1908224 RepID=UPI003D0BC33E